METSKLAKKAVTLTETTDSLSVELRKIFEAFPEIDEFDFQQMTPYVI